jgi:hypothetical protein
MSLEDVTELIERPSPFSDEETSALISLAAELLEIGLRENPMQYIQPTFPNELCADVLDLLQQQVEYVLPKDDQLVMVELEEIISMALQMVYISVAPPRSEPRENASSLKDVNVFAITKIIAALRATPQPDQRTTEWYEFRYRYVTASSIWKAFFSESSRNQLICDKCKPLDAGKYTAGGQSLESPMHWGHKYEPVSIQIYEDMFKTQVSDFGCLPHPTISFLAASPDGINTLKSSSLYGRMLEVKNIVNRDIDGIPKLEYWIQMQMQMEVCGLEESDFLETRFKEYADYDEFVSDNDGISYNKSRLGELKGQIILFMKEGQQPFYVYAPLNIMLNKETALFWEDSVMQEFAELTWVKNIYWRLDQLSCVLVKRNRLWFTSALPVLEKLWIDIQHDKVHGFSHRLPQKRLNQSSSSSIQIDTEMAVNSGGGCFINVDTMFD